MKRKYTKIGVLILVIPLVTVLGAELIALIISNTFQSNIANQILLIARVVRYIAIPIIVIIFPVSIAIILYGLLGNKNK